MVQRESFLISDKTLPTLLDFGTDVDFLCWAKLPSASVMEASAGSSFRSSTTPCGSVL